LDPLFVGFALGIVGSDSEFIVVEFKAEPILLLCGQSQVLLCFSNFSSQISYLTVLLLYCCVQPFNLLRKQSDLTLVFRDAAVDLRDLDYATFQLLVLIAGYLQLVGQFADLACR
jgi:hypothetical protein